MILCTRADEIDGHQKVEGFNPFWVHFFDAAAARAIVAHFSVSPTTIVHSSYGENAKLVQINLAIDRVITIFRLRSSLMGDWNPNCETTTFTDFTFYVNAPTKQVAVLADD